MFSCLDSILSLAGLLTLASDACRPPLTLACLQAASQVTLSSGGEDHSKLDSG